jgi:uncharacterized secreted protein with C-terminal beta-propeller domain
MALTPLSVFTSARMFDHFAYFVTLLQTDPFYVVDFPDQATLRIRGELKISSGFSRYLHSMIKKDTSLIGIGQETDKNGGNLGFKIDMYNATDPTELCLHSRYSDPTKWSSGAAEWDEEKSLRYVPFDDESGLLVLPVNKRIRVNKTAGDDVNMMVPIPINSQASTIDRVTATQCFSGFSVFTISDTGGIAWPLSDISQVQDVDLCFYCAG